jgi:resuscitation-promoting factor RpfA
MGKHSVKKSARQKTGYAVGGLALAGAASLVVGAGTAHADVDWSAVIACESGGNAKAQNPSSTASGLFQFLDSSWRAYGGGKYAARAKDATPAQQYEIANHAYAQSGLTPWAASRSCWSGKVNTKTITIAKKPAPTAPAPAVGGSYTVRAGDTLALIAEAHGTTWQQLAELNKGTVADPNLIYPGQAIKLSA